MERKMVKTVATDGKQRRQIKPMKLIENDRARRITYTKRKECIMKKTMELATLCGIKVCTLCFGPNGAVETWPENQSEVREMINMYKESGKKGKKVFNQSSGHCLEEGISGAKNEISKKGFLGFEDDWLNGLSEEKLRIFLRQLESKLEAVTTKIESLKWADEKNREFGNEIVIPNWFGMYSPMEKFEMESDFGNYHQPLQTLGLDNLSNPFQSLQNTVGFDAPMDSLPPIWPLNYGYPMSTFDDVMGSTSSATTSWPMNFYGDPMFGGTVSFPLTYDEGSEESNLNSMNNYSDQQLFGSYSSFPQPSVLDEGLLSSMF